MPDATEPVSISRHVPEGSVIVTPAAMYAQLQDVVKEVQHLSTLLDPAINDLRGDVANLWSALNKERDVREAADRAEVEARDKAIRAEADARQSAVRWGIGTLILAAGVVIAALALVI